MFFSASARWTLGVSSVPPLATSLRASLARSRRSGERQVWVAAERQPLIAVCEGEGLYPLWRDPDAEAGAGGIADRVKGLARLERPNNRIG